MVALCKNRMKKVLTLILSVCMILSVIAVAVSAEDGATVNFEAITMYAAKGTPEAIDGVMDEVYKKAPEIKVEGAVPTNNGKVTRTKVRMRILWDEEFLYTFFDITDNYITPEEHEKQWTENYTDLNGFWNGDNVNVLINTSGKIPSEPANYRNEPGIVGCSVYSGGVNYGLTGNKPYAGAGHAAMWADRIIKDDDPDKAAKEAEVAAAKAVLDAAWYQTRIVTEEVTDSNGNPTTKTVGWTCEMKIKFESYTPTADDVIGFVAQIDCDDKAAEKTPGSGNYATRECRLYTNPKALEQVQLQCYDNTNYFDKLVLAVEPPVDPAPTPDNPDPTPDNPDPTPGNPDPAPGNPDPTPDNPDPTPNTPASTTEENTDAKTDAPKDDKKGGCASSIAELVLLTPVLAGFALLKKKKKSE